MAPLINLAKEDVDIKPHVIVTGQHREMLDQVLSLFEITPEVNLEVMREAQTLSGISARILEGLDKELDPECHSCVVVHGDTSTTFAAALAAFYKKIPVFHVEAGLRTFDLLSPWPEEANRKLTSAITRVHFAPTETAKQNLIAEGVPTAAIDVTGNTVIDALLSVSRRLDTDFELGSQISRQLPFLNQNRRMILVTGHRRENFGQGFESICDALLQLSERYSDVDIVYAVHLNPNVKKPVESKLRGRANLYLIEPQGYLSFVYLMKKSFLILTDSGGIQEEAPAIGKPVLVMRNTTERPEGVKAGTVMLVGADKDAIVRGVEQLLTNQKVYQSMSLAVNPYGTGKASHQILERIKEEVL